MAIREVLNCICLVKFFKNKEWCYKMIWFEVWSNRKIRPSWECRWGSAKSQLFHIFDIFCFSDIFSYWNIFLTLIYGSIRKSIESRFSKYWVFLCINFLSFSHFLPFIFFWKWSRSDRKAWHDHVDKFTICSHRENHYIDFYDYDGLHIILN